MSTHWHAAPLQGTSAADDVRAFFDRQRSESAAAAQHAARRVLRPPLQRAQQVAAADRRVPAAARALMQRAVQHGYEARCTYAYGWTPDKNGDEETLPVMEETGVVLDSGHKEKRKVGEKEKPPVHSIMLVLRHPSDRQIVLAGYWQDGAFDFGMAHHDQAGGWVRFDGITLLREAVEEYAPGEAYLF